MANAAAWLLEGRSTERIVLADDSRALTGHELTQRVRALAGFVHARARIGSIVPIVGENSIELTIAYLGVLHSGCVPAPMPVYRPETFTALAHELSPALVLCDASSAEVVRAGLPNVVVVTDAAGEPIDAVDVPDDALGVLLHTSGSTGRPRGVMLSNANLRANTRMIAALLALTPADRALIVLPFYYCYGLSMLHVHLRAGGSVWLASATLPEDLLATLARSQATGLPGVPSLFQLLVARSSLSKRSFPHLRYVMSSGGHLAERTVRELRAAQPDVAIYMRYGITETTAAASCLPPDRIHDKLGSIGRGLAGAPLRVEAPDGTEVVPGSGAVGEIVVAGEHVTLGYFHDPEATAARFRDGTFRTGDLATVDADGFVYIVGRVSEFVKTSGHRVAPQVVERVIARLAAVEEVAVYGIPHRLRGEALAAAVVVRPAHALSVDEVRQTCVDGLAPHEVPITIELVSSLPKNANGKLDRKRLADAARASMAPNG